MNNASLVIAGILSCIASLLHIAVIFGGPDWYRFFGAGEQMAVLAEQGSLRPTITTLIIASILLVWGLYAFSGARVIPRLPFLRFCLVAITAVYLIRGLGGIVLAFIPGSLDVEQLGFSFMIWSSLICTIYGGVHLLGIVNGWTTLRKVAHKNLSS